MIIEKPFGHDLESANALNREIGACIHENQIYRIDHYLGKETVQNILAFRFGNGIFEPLWNNNYIDHVQITVAETVGVEHRGAFYEATGALRDMVPNHILALVSLTAMEPPNSFDSEPVRDEKTKVLRAIRPLKPEDVPKWAVRGQYGAGTLDGKPVPGYRDGAASRSQIQHRDLRRAEARDRQLAMVGRAVLPAHGKADGESPHRNRNQVQSAADAAVSADRCQPPRAERTGDAPSAERGHLAQLQRKDARDPWSRSAASI